MRKHFSVTQFPNGLGEKSFLEKNLFSNTEYLEHNSTSVLQQSATSPHSNFTRKLNAAELNPTNQNSGPRPTLTTAPVSPKILTRRDETMDEVRSATDERFSAGPQSAGQSQSATICDPTKANRAALASRMEIFIDSCPNNLSQGVSVQIFEVTSSNVARHDPNVHRAEEGQKLSVECQENLQGSSRAGNKDEPTVWAILKPRT